MIFLDTNILVYAVDFRDIRKQEIAEKIIEDALGGVHDYSLAVQTLSEFANVALAKLKKSPLEISELVEAYMEIPTIRPDGKTVLRGLKIRETYGLQFYDSMMVAAAEQANAEVLYTEDLNNGQFYGHVRAINPFA